MPTIFPREEKAEALFDKIAKDPRACKRLMDAFYEGVACDEDSSVEEERVLVDKQVFTNALFTAYKNKDFKYLVIADYNVRDIMYLKCRQKINDQTYNSKSNNLQSCG